MTEKIMSWTNREINVVVEELKTKKRYEKSFSEGYLSALKKVQTKLNRITGEENMEKKK